MRGCIIEDILPLLEDAPLWVIVGIFLWRVSQILRKFAEAYADNAAARKAAVSSRVKDDEQLRAYQDELALELAAYKKEQAALNLQTALVNSKIAAQLPTLIGTQEQTLSAVELSGKELGEQAEFVHGDLRTAIERGHDYLSEALRLISVEQDVQGERIKGIADKQDETQDETAVNGEQKD